MAELYPVTELMIKKQGVLYPVTHVFIKGERKIPIDTDFSITVNSGDDAAFILPTTGRLNNTNNTYNWIVDWGDGTTSEHSGAGYHMNGSGISHTYPQANTLYKIKIAPQDPNEPGWLSAFGFAPNTAGSSSTENKQKIMVVDGQLTEQMVRRSATDTYVLTYWFYGCSNLTMGQSFNLPQDITSGEEAFCSAMFYGCTSLQMSSVFNLPQGITISDKYFCQSMFQNCTNLTMNGIFQLPQGLTSAGARFCESMFVHCTNLTMNTIFQLPQSITSVGDSFCYMMFYGCTNLTMNIIFQLPQGVASVGKAFCYCMFYNCTNLTMNSIFQLPQGIAEIGTSFCGSMFKDCTNLTMNTVFQLPQGITNASGSFCDSMFYGCTSLTMNGVFQLPQGITGISSFCDSTFYGCTSLTTGVVRFFGSLALPVKGMSDYKETFKDCAGLVETLSDIPQLSVRPSFAVGTFRGCPAELIAPLHNNWK